MADDLEVTGRFDASGIVSGIEEAASAVQEGTEQMTASFNAVETSESSLEAAFTGGPLIIEQLTGIKESAEEASDALATLAANAEAIALPATSVTPGASSEAQIRQGYRITGTPGAAGPPVPEFLPTEDPERPAIAEASATAMADEAVSAEALNAAFATLGSAELSSVVGAQDLTEAETEAASELGAAEVQTQSTASSLALIEPGALQAAQATAQLEAGLAGAGQAGEAIVQQFTGIAASADTATPAISEMDQALLQMSEVQQQSSLENLGLQGFVESANEVAPAIQEETQAVAAQDDAFAQMQEAQVAAIAEANDLAEAQANLAESGLAEMQAVQGTSQAQVEAATGAAQLGIQSSSATKAVQDLADGIAWLNTQANITSNSSDVVAAKLNEVQASAQRLGYQLVQTAEGLKLVALEEDEVTSSSTRMDGAMTYAGLRIGGNAIGAGYLGTALGVVARASSALTPIIAAAFPIFGAMALVEVIDTIVSKIQKMEDELNKATAEFDDLAASTYETADALEIQNLKMEDTITKLEGGIAQNRIKEAILENERAAEQLNKTLEQTIQKEQQALEKADIGIITSLITGQQPTNVAGLGSKYKEAQDELSNYHLALAQKGAADEAYFNNRTAENKAAADQATTDLIAAHNKYAEAVKKVDKDLKDEIKRTEATPVITGTGEFGAQSLGITERTKQDNKELEDSYRTQKTVVAELNQELYAGELAQKRLLQGQEDRLVVANKQKAADERSADKTVTEADVKARQDQAQQTLQLVKTAADNRLKLQEAAIEKEKQQAILGGQDKQAAEIDADNKILAAKQVHYAALIAAQTTYINTSKALSKTQLDIEERDLRGPQRVAAQTQTNQQIKDLVEKGNAEIQSLRDASDALEVLAKAKIVAEVIALTEREEQRVIAAKQEEARAAITALSQQTSDEQSKIKEAADAKLKIVQLEESSHLITFQQGYEQRIAIIEDEKNKSQEATDAEIISLRALQTQIQFLIQYYEELGTKQELLKPLITTYDNLANAIKKAETAQQKLNASFGSAEQDALINKIKEQNQALDQFVTSANSAMESWVENVMTSGHSLQQDFNELFIAIDRDFIRMIAHMVEESNLFKAIEAKIRGVFAKIFHVPPIPQPGQGGAAGTATTTATTTTENAQKVANATTTSSQIVAIQQQENAQLAALYQQDLAAYQAAQAQKTGQINQGVVATTTAEGQKTTVTAAGEAQRTAIGTTGVAAKTTQESTKVAVHTTSQTTQTATTAAGETTRSSIESLGLIGKIAREGAKVSVHVASETAQTAATVAGAAARATVGVAEDLASVVRAAAVAAAHAIKWIFEEVPWPANLALAPAMGAAAFGLVKAFGAFQSGGLVEGPGTETSDSVPIRASAGEYVVRASAVRAIGISALHQINQGVLPETVGIHSDMRMASGGIVALNSSSSTMQGNSLALSSNLTSGVRGITKGSSFTASTASHATPGQQGNPVHVSFSPSIYAIDGPSVSRFFSDHEDKLGASLTRAIRKGLVKVT